MATLPLEFDNVIDGVPRGIRFVKGNTQLCVLGQPPLYPYEQGERSKSHIVLLDWLKPHNVARIEVDNHYVYGFDVSPSGNLVAVYGSQGIDVIDLATEKVIASFREIELFCVSFQDENSLLVVQVFDNVLTLNIETGVTFQVFEAQENVSAISWHPTLLNVVLSSAFEAGAILTFLDIPDAKSPASEVGGMNFSAEAIRAVFSPDGQYLAAVDWAVRLYNFPELELLAAFDLNGQSFEIAPYDEIDSYYPPEERRPLEWSNPTFSPNSSLICESPEGRIFEWDVKNLKLKNEWQGHVDGSRHLDVSSDGKWLAVTGGFGDVKVFDIS